MATRPCPYCAEEIQAEAVLCRYCRSRLGAMDPARWRRDHPERRIAGVAAAIAHGAALPVGMVRLGFIVASFVHLLGPLVYAALWLVIPPRPGEPSMVERVITLGRALLDDLLGTTARPKTPDGPSVMSGDPHA